MSRRLTATVMGLLYDLLMLLLWALLLPAVPFWPKLRQFMRWRTGMRPLMQRLRKLGADPVYLYCASMGELEQAMPLVEALRERAQPVFIFLHSGNGYEHALRLGLRDVAALTPVDFFLNWLLLFAVKRPGRCIINRHGYWPGFVLAAVLRSRLCIVNAVDKTDTRILNRWWLQFIHRCCSEVFFVNEPGRMQPNYRYTGDTRWDRLRQRAARERQVWESMALPPAQRILVLGNAYPEDARVLRQSLQRADWIDAGWQILVIPARPAMKDRIAETLGAETSRVQIIPAMGNLFHYYARADAAWIGGGFSAGIHNSLEGYFFGIPLISGPQLNHQPDALLLQEKGLLQVFRSAEAFHTLLPLLPAKRKAAETIYPTASPVRHILQQLYPV